MRRSRLIRLAGWMQRIGEQQQTVNQLRIFCGENGRLATSIRMAPEKGRSLVQFADDTNGLSQSRSIRCSRPGGWIGGDALTPRAKVQTGAAWLSSDGGSSERRSAAGRR